MATEVGAASSTSRMGSRRGGRSICSTRRTLAISASEGPSNSSASGCLECCSPCVGVCAVQFHKPFK